MSNSLSFIATWNLLCFPLSNRFFIFFSMKNNKIEVANAVSPIKKKKKEDFINPLLVSSLFYIKYPVNRGITH